MESVVGIFQSAASAEQAVEELLGSGIGHESIVFLSNEAPKHDGIKAATQNELHKVPTTDAEGDGMGPAMGAVMGGALGASVGMTTGATMATLLVPGLGSIFAIGVGAAAALGLGGAAAGAKAGTVAEHSLDVGVPKDDVQFYHELLRRGRSIVIASVDSEGLASKAKEILKRQGSEDAAAARSELGTAA